jgi:hypothetical protein
MRFIHDNKGLGNPDLVLVTFKLIHLPVRRRKKEEGRRKEGRRRKNEPVIPILYEGA